MMLLRNKIILLLGLFVLLMAIVGGLNVWALHRIMSDSIQTVTEQHSPALMVLGRVKTTGMQMCETIASYAFLESELGALPPMSAPELTAIQEKYQQGYDALQADLQLLAANEKRLYPVTMQDQLETAAEDLYRSGLRLIEGRQQAQTGGSIRVLWDEFEADEAAFVALTTDISETQMQELQRQAGDTLARAQTMIWAYGVAVTVIVLLGVLAVGRFWKGVIHRVNAMNEMANSLGAGELQVRLEDDQSDEIGALARSLNQMAANLHETRNALQRTGTDLAMQLQERQAAEAMLAEAATHDSLTSLPNRAMFFEQFNHAIALADRYHGRMALLFIDMDGLKTVNDAFGHDGGDMLIVQVAKRLRETIRKSDYVARLAGDEFVVILENSNLEEGGVEAVCAKLVKMLGEPYDIRGRRVRVTASIGASLFPEHGSDVDELLRKADSAMYQVKRRGKNNYAIFEAH
jgi:diguanylate cyclase (GGDEF)-like protein